jgi:type IV pilus assembly protein PilA
MKNKKGFTLIELIAVIVILGLVLLIAIPFFSGSLKVFRDDYYSTLNGSMKNAGQNFFTDNRSFLPHSYLKSQVIDLNTLEDKRYINEVKDYNGDK